MADEQKMGATKWVWIFVIALFLFYLGKGLWTDLNTSHPREAKHELHGKATANSAMIVVTNEDIFAWHDCELVLNLQAFGEDFRRSLKGLDPQERRVFDLADFATD